MPYVISSVQKAFGGTFSSVWNFKSTIGVCHSWNACLGVDRVHSHSGSRSHSAMSYTLKPLGTFKFGISRFGFAAL